MNGWRAGLADRVSIEMKRALRATALRIVDREDLAPHHGPTLGVWRERLLERRNILCELGFDDEFLRRWEFFAPVLLLLSIRSTTGIPPIERRSVERRGEEHRRYQRTTSAFIHWFPRRER